MGGGEIKNSKISATLIYIGICIPTNERKRKCEFSIKVNVPNIDLV